MSNNHKLDIYSSFFRSLPWCVKRLRGDRGSALVEYALTFIVFMSMLLGITDFGRAMYAYHFVSSAAREGARYAMVRGCTPTTTICPTAADSSSVQTFVKNVPLGIDSSKVTVNASWAPDHKPGSVVTVQASYSFTFVFPFASSTPWSMRSTSKMVIVQ